MHVSAITVVIPLSQRMLKHLCLSLVRSVLQADQRQRLDPLPSEPLSNEKGMKTILSKFADKTSVQGILYIKESRRWASRSFWIFLFMVGTGAVVWQLIDIVQKYMSHPVSTTIDIGYSTLNFPTVTICNMNPLRKSMLHLDPRMETYIRTLSTKWDEGTYAGKPPPTRPDRKVSSQTNDWTIRGSISVVRTKLS